MSAGVADDAGDGGGAGEVLGVVGQFTVAVGFDVVVDAAGHGVALVVDVGAVRRRAQLVGRFVLVLHDEEVLVAIVGDVGAEGIQALELLHHVVGLRLADDGRPVLVPNMVGHMGQGLDLFVALDLSKCNAHGCILPRRDKTFRKSGHKIEFWVFFTGDMTQLTAASLRNIAFGDISLLLSCCLEACKNPELDFVTKSRRFFARAALPL